MKRAIYYSIAVVIFLGAGIFSYFKFFGTDGIPKNTNVAQSNATLYTNTSVGCDEPFLSSEKGETCREAIETSKQWYTNFGVLGYLCLDSTEHFEYLAKKIPWGWAESFKEKSGYNNLNGVCVTTTDVYYVKLIGPEDPHVAGGSTYYILGVYNIAKKTTTEHNPQFKGFGSMGNQGCLPQVTTTKNQPKVYFECDATTENAGEPPHINKNAKELYAKYNFDLLKKTFTLVDSVNKDLFQSPFTF